MEFIYGCDGIGHIYVNCETGSEYTCDNIQVTCPDIGMCDMQATQINNVTTWDCIAPQGEDTLVAGITTYHFYV